MEKKYYIKMIDTRDNRISYKAHKCSYGWYSESNKDIAWKFSKAGAKQIIARYEEQRDFGHNHWSKSIIWELEEA